MSLKDTIIQLKEEKLKIDLSSYTPYNEVKSSQLTSQIEVLTKRLKTLNLQDELTSLEDDLAKELSEMIEAGNHISSDNSYKTESTGYRLVEDVEFTPYYESLIEALDTTTKLIAIIENLYGSN